MGVLMITPDPYRGFRELCRVLRPGGVLVVSVYNTFSRLPHVLKQRLVWRVAGADPDRRVAWAKRLFPRTCRALQRNRGDDSDVLLYDAFAIPHESRHSVGEVLHWFDRNDIQYLGAFGPVTLRDTFLALRLIRHHEFDRFRGFFDGFPLASSVVDRLSRLAGRPPVDAWLAPRAFRRPWALSRGLVQLCWALLGFRFSIFSLSGRKPGSAATGWVQGAGGDPEFHR
jgi:SAM-dependent methyltransferase